MYPGFNKENWQGTNCGWQQVYYSNKWMETHDFNYDWAICVLEKNVGDQLGYFGVAYYNSASSLNEKEIRCYGYPGAEGYNGQKQYTAWGWIHKIDRDILIYEGYGIGGMSGGPIVDLFDVGTIWGNIAANNNGGNHTDCASHRITKDMVDVISKYRD